MSNNHPYPTAPAGPSHNRPYIPNTSHSRPQASAGPSRSGPAGTSLPARPSSSHGHHASSSSSGGYGAPGGGPNKAKASVNTWFARTSEEEEREQGEVSPQAKRRRLSRGSTADDRGGWREGNDRRRHEYSAEHGRGRSRSRSRSRDRRAPYEHGDRRGPRGHDDHLANTRTRSRSRSRSRSSSASASGKAEQSNRRVPWNQRSDPVTRASPEKWDPDVMVKAIETFSTSLSAMMTSQSALSLANAHSTRLSTFHTTGPITSPSHPALLAAQTAVSTAQSTLQTTTRDAQTAFVALVELCLARPGASSEHDRSPEKVVDMDRGRDAGAGEGMGSEGMKALQGLKERLNQLEKAQQSALGSVSAATSGQGSGHKGKGRILGPSPGPPVGTPQPPPPPSADLSNPSVSSIPPTIDANSGDTSAVPAGPSTTTRTSAPLSTSLKPPTSLRHLLNTLITRVDALDDTASEWSERFMYLETNISEREAEAADRAVRRALRSGIIPASTSTPTFGEKNTSEPEQDERDRREDVWGGTEGGWEGLERERDPSGALRGLIEREEGEEAGKGDGEGAGDRLEVGQSSEEQEVEESEEEVELVEPDRRPPVDKTRSHGQASVGNMSMDMDEVEVLEVLDQAAKEDDTTSKFAQQSPDADRSEAARTNGVALQAQIDILSAELASVREQLATLTAKQGVEQDKPAIVTVEGRDGGEDDREARDAEIVRRVREEMEKDCSAMIKREMQRAIKMVSNSRNRASPAPSTGSNGGGGGGGAGSTGPSALGNAADSSALQADPVSVNGRNTSAAAAPSKEVPSQPKPVVGNDHTAIAAVAAAVASSARSASPVIPTKLYVNPAAIEAIAQHGVAKDDSTRAASSSAQATQPSKVGQQQIHPSQQLHPTQTLPSRRARSHSTSPLASSSSLPPITHPAPPPQPPSTYSAPPTMASKMFSLQSQQQAISALLAPTIPPALVARMLALLEPAEMQGIARVLLDEKLDIANAVARWSLRAFGTDAGEWEREMTRREASKGDSSDGSASGSGAQQQRRMLQHLPPTHGVAAVGVQRQTSGSSRPHHPQTQQSQQQYHPQLPPQQQGRAPSVQAQSQAITQTQTAVSQAQAQAHLGGATLPVQADRWTPKQHTTQVPHTGQTGQTAPPVMTRSTSIPMPSLGQRIHSSGNTSTGHPAPAGYQPSQGVPQPPVPPQSQHLQARFSGSPRLDQGSPQLQAQGQPQRLSSAQMHNAGNSHAGGSVPIPDRPRAQAGPPTIAPHAPMGQQGGQLSNQGQTGSSLAQRIGGSSTNGPTQPSQASGFVGYAPPPHQQTPAQAQQTALRAIGTGGAVDLGGINASFSASTEADAVSGVGVGVGLGARLRNGTASGQGNSAVPSLQSRLTPSTITHPPNPIHAHGGPGQSLRERISSAPDQSMSVSAQLGQGPTGEREEPTEVDDWGQWGET